MKDNTLHKKIKNLRLEHNYKQTYVASRIGISQASYSRIENGDMRLLTFKNIENLSQLYNFSLTAFLEMGGEFLIERHPQKTL